VSLSISRWQLFIYLFIYWPTLGLVISPHFALCSLLSVFFVAFYYQKRVVKIPFACDWTLVDPGVILDAATG
jgi:hypothetical protein